MGGTQKRYNRIRKDKIKNKKSVGTENEKIKRK